MRASIVANSPDLTLDIILYGTVVLGLFGFLWIYHGRRDRQFFELERRKITFHCIRCDHLYTEKPGVEIAPCNRCGHQNARLKF